MLKRDVTLRCQTAAAAGAGMLWPEAADGRRARASRTCAACCREQKRMQHVSNVPGGTLHVWEQRTLHRLRHACCITAQRALRHQSKGRASTEMSGVCESGFHVRSSGSWKLAMMGRNSLMVMTCSFAMTTCSAAAVASGTLGPTQGGLRCAWPSASPCPGT
jgi:hypothetical protein